MGKGRVRVTAVRATAVLATVALGAGLSLFSVRAVAVIAEVTEPPALVPVEVLEVTSNLPSDGVLDLRPGESVYWQVGADLTENLAGSLVLELRKSGDLADHAEGLVVTIDRCSDAWTSLDAVPLCAADEHHVLVATPLDNLSNQSPIYDLAGIPLAHGKHLLVTLSLNVAAGAAEEDLMGLSGEIGIGLTAAGLDLPAMPEPAGDVPGEAPGGALAATGIDVLALGLIALGAIGFGALAAARRRRPGPAVLPAADAPGSAT